MHDGITPGQFHAAEGTQDWRVVGDGMTAYFLTASFEAGARLVAAIADLPGIEDHRPDVDLRNGGVTVRVLTVSETWYGPSQRDVEMARQISELARGLGLAADPSAVQSVLVIPGAPSAAEVMPFWQAVLGYDRRPDSPDQDLVDRHRRGPAVWVEAMDEPRQGGGAIHIAVWVPYEEAEARVAAALAAGGRVVRDQYAPAWWTLADSAGNEVDISTPLTRD